MWKINYSVILKIQFHKWVGVVKVPIMVMYWTVWITDKMEMNHNKLSDIEPCLQSRLYGFKSAVHFQDILDLFILWSYSIFFYFRVRTWNKNEFLNWGQTLMLELLLFSVRSVHEVSPACQRRSDWHPHSFLPHLIALKSTHLQQDCCCFWWEKYGLNTGWEIGCTWPDKHPSKCH